MSEPVSHDKIRSLCRERIGIVLGAPSEDPLFEDRLCQIVHQNISSGRFKRYNSARAKEHQVTLAKYIERIIPFLHQEDARMQRLRRGDHDEWARLENFLSRRASSLISRLLRETRSEDRAHDFAQRACEIIFRTRRPYPFDVPFAAWVTTILKNEILKCYIRSREPMDRVGLVDSLEEPRSLPNGQTSALGELLPSEDASAAFDNAEDQMVLVGAIARLQSALQRDVISLTFIDGLGDDQIAKRLGKSKQAVYNLRNRALERLKEILGNDRPQELGSQIHHNK